MGDWRSHPSKEDLTQKISTSVFVTNFPEQFSSRDLWRTCQVYGRVVDAFIPNRRSRTARFQRPSLKNVSNGNRFNEKTKLHTGGSNRGHDVTDKGTSYAGVVKQKGDTNAVEVGNLTFNEIDDRAFSSGGKSFWVRAKEVSGWVPDFMEDENEEEDSDSVESVDTLKFPPGFTPEDNGIDNNDVGDQIFRGENVNSKKTMDEKSFPEASNSNTKMSSKVEGNVSCCSGHFRQTEDPPTGGSMLQLLEDVVKVDHVIRNWMGETIIMGDFNEVRSKEERHGSTFNAHSAAIFNSLLFDSLSRVPWEERGLAKDGILKKKSNRPFGIVVLINPRAQTDLPSVSIEDIGVLSNRLWEFLGGLVNEVQSAFVSDRQILDGPFILNDLIHWCKSKKKQTLIFKVDFEKAFDSVRWDYLDDVLNLFGFGAKWRSWSSNCLHLPRGSMSREW
ncbi:RNA-directed DNA polymerase, eukaryota, reverse transcriptase zinc-binding domain protein [Tanacetum coccineum]